LKSFLSFFFFFSFEKSFNKKKRFQKKKILISSHLISSQLSDFSAQPWIQISPLGPSLPIRHHHHLISKPPFFFEKFFFSFETFFKRKNSQSQLNSLNFSAQPWIQISPLAHPCHSLPFFITT
jgi:hypothetical protein